MNQLIQFFFFFFSDSVKSTAVALNTGFMDWINQTTHSLTESVSTYRNANPYFGLKMSSALLLCYVHFWNARSVITEINGI